jgi:hypothetical protein
MRKGDVKMATLFLTDRFMRAAEAILAQGEHIEVVYCGPGERQTLRLAGRGPEPKTAQLSLWALHTVVEGMEAVKFTDVLLPAKAAQRLEMVAREQETVWRVDPATGRKYAAMAPLEPKTPEMARALEFAAAARQRTRDGRFADCTHRAEPAGVR